MVKGGGGGGGGGGEEEEEEELDYKSTENFNLRLFLVSVS